MAKTIIQIENLIDFVTLFGRPLSIVKNIINNPGITINALRISGEPEIIIIYITNNNNERCLTLTGIQTFFTKAYTIAKII